MPARLVALLLVLTAVISGGVAAGVSWGVASSVAGAAGADGTAGATGPAGDDGKGGATGPAGADGSDGATGATGPRGATGPAGKDGSAVAVGATGPAGPAGPVGPQGLQGIAGTPGTNGTNGTNGTDGASAPTFSASYGGLSPSSFLGSRFIAPLFGPVPDGPALVGYSLNVTTAGFSPDTVGCELRDNGAGVFAQTAPSPMVFNVANSVATTVVVNLTTDTNLELWCDSTSFNPWVVTDVSIYAISFAP